MIDDGRKPVRIGEIIPDVLAVILGVPREEAVAYLAQTSSSLRQPDLPFSPSPQRIIYCGDDL